MSNKSLLQKIVIFHLKNLLIYWLYYGFYIEIFFCFNSNLVIVIDKTHVNESFSGYLIFKNI